MQQQRPRTTKNKLHKPFKFRDFLLCSVKNREPKGINKHKKFIPDDMFNSHSLVRCFDIFKCIKKKKRDLSLVIQWRAPNYLDCMLHGHNNKAVLVI